jgi:hypothetical protein
MYFTAERLLLIINISCYLFLPSQTIIDYVVFIVLQAGLLYFSPLSENNAMGESLFCFPSVGIIALAYLFPNESLTDIKKKYC